MTNIVPASLVPHRSRILHVMDRIDLAIQSSRIVTPEGVRSGCIAIAQGRIVDVLPSALTEVARTLDVGDAVVMPGVIDTHVHINEPGRTEWEGFATATRAAAAGGVTTLVDMPLNSIPATTTMTGIDAKRSAAGGQCHVDVGFWGGLVPGNLQDLSSLIDAGVLGFKCFLSPSGVDEFANASEGDIRAAAPLLVKAGLPLLVHAEDPAVLDHAPVISAGHERDYAAYLATRPREAERSAIQMLIRISTETGLHIHIVHVADADSLALLADARYRGVRITAETCQHYLTFAAEDIPAGATLFKCAPPIRGRENRERLWHGLGEGALDLIATDHSPSPPDGKCLNTGDLGRAWGGIASLQLALSAAWTGASARGYGLHNLTRWLCEAPANLAGIGHRKGRIAPGYDADLVVWKPEQEFIVHGTSLQHRHSLTAYEGTTLAGIVQCTFLRGVEVFGADGFASPRGQLLMRESH